MPTLSDRQIQLLKIIIEKYIDSALPVGSETIEKEYPSLGVSPATIRNEMVKLTKMKYLVQPHTSAGRIPTSQGMRFYVDQLMKEKSLSTAEEVAVKGKVWEAKDRLDRLLRQATCDLAQRTKTVAVATTDMGDIYVSGAANILSMPEFYDIEMTRNMLSLLDEVARLQEIFLREENPEEDDIHVVFGEDLEEKNLAPFGFVFSRFQTGTRHAGSLGVIGPSRLNYPYVIPVIRYLGNLINEMAGQW
ncbi:MAG: hypothetical protein M1120_00800 [Patescibacteria group bacterium]|nr:hypothetical protein [Patescibacteria group bacterium]